MKSRDLSLRAALFFLIVVMPAAAFAAEKKPETQTVPPPLYGWVDMHTHPMSHLAFGGKLVHGSPDLGIVVPSIPDGAGCRHYDIATTRTDASTECRAIHEGWDLLSNTCGDDLRNAFISGLESTLGARSRHESAGATGYPTFNSFPAHDDLTHQQMWVDWIYRAYSNGLRVMVALAVNNRTLAAAVMGSGDINGDDAASAQVQLDQMKVMVSQNSWMQIAHTPQELRNIVSAGNLAIILGTEIDNIGDMQDNPTVQTSADLVSKSFIDGQLQSLWNQGVRYVFPVHVVDNKLGGTAIYQDQFNVSNYHQTGDFWDIRCAPVADGITHLFEVSGFDLPYAIIKVKIGIDPLRNPPDPPICSLPDFAGHANVKGLSPLGEYAVGQMMRMGFMLDVDHMSERSVQRTLEIAEQNAYPVNSGHDGPRMASWANKNENERTDSDYTRIGALGGMVGLGSSDLASHYVRNYHYVNALVSGGQIAIGTDANGMVILPGPDPAATVTYNTLFPRLTDGSRTWDVNIDGVANYGLFADYVRSWTTVGMTSAQEQAFYSTAEGFAHMWERVAIAQAALIPTPPTARAGGPYSVNEGAGVTLDATATTDPNQPSNTLTYAWDFNNDGVYDDATGSAPVYHAVDGPATVTVHLRVTDSDGMTDTASATITVANVPPSATLTQLPPALVFQGLSAGFQFTGVTDPSTVDVTAGFSFRVDCTADGIWDTAWSTSSTASCTYPLPGTFTVNGQVRDKDGGIGNATTSVTVLSVAQAMDAIAAMINALGTSGALNHGQVTALIAKIDQARAKYTGGNKSQAIDHLETLRHQVENFANSGALTSAQAANLLFWIGQLEASISAS